MSMLTPFCHPLTMPMGPETFAGMISASPCSSTSTSMTDSPPLDSDLDNETNPFGKLVSLVKEHDDLVAELSVLRVKLNRAAAYLEIEGKHPKLAQANFDRLRMKHSALLTRLRANRLEARRFLQRLDSETNPI